MATQSRFTIYDFMVFFGTFGLSLCIGIYFGWRNRKHDNVVNYFLANRKLSVIPTALSLTVTFQSSLMIVGFPAEVYAYGLKYAYHLIGSCTSYIMAGLVIVPVFHPLKLTSTNKYFKLRYNDNTVRYVSMTFGIIYYVIYSATVIFGTCVALEYLMGIPYWGTICIYSIVTAIYTSVGGMKAVIWTDVLQISIMAMGVFAIVIKCCIEVGDLSNLVQIGSSRLNFNDFRPDPTIRYQFWNLSCGTFITYLVTCFQQPCIQRINSTPSITTARHLYVLSGITYALLALFVCFEGVAIFAYYNYIGCDPVTSGRIESPDKLIPLAVADLFSHIPGLSGLFIAALSSAALSTLSSSLSSLGAVTYDDVIREKYPNISEENAILISKLVVFLYGMLTMGLAFIISTLPGSVVGLCFALLGCVDGPTLSLFILSLFYRKTTTKGLLAGAFVGCGFILWLNIGSMMETVANTPTLPPASTECCFNNISIASNNTTSCTSYIHTYSNISILNDTAIVPETQNLTPIQRFYSLSFMLYTSIGCFVSILVAVPVSWLTAPPENFDERCIFNFRKHVIEVFFKNEKSEHDSFGVVGNKQSVELMDPLMKHTT